MANDFELPGYVPSFKAVRWWTALRKLTAAAILLCLAAWPAVAFPLPAPSGKLEAANAAAPATAQNAPYGISTDDLPDMVQRRNIRALVLLNPIGFFYDDGHPMGIMYDALRELESFVNQKLNTGAMKVEVTFIPVRPEQAESALLSGVGDLIAYALIITPERKQQVAFTVPLQSNVKQVVVTGPGMGPLPQLSDLGGKQLWVNPLSANYQSLQAFNQQLRAAGKPPILVKPAADYLTDDDLLQMVNAEAIPATITSLARAKLWFEILPHLTPRPDLVVAGGEQTAWALRNNNPQLKQLLDEFLAPRAEGTSFGNTLLRRYLQNTQWLKNATAPEEIRKFKALRSTFQKYGAEYGFDYLMLMAQGYQESMLEQDRRNGPAVGIMQVIPRYASAAPISVPDVFTAQGNIHAGVKMLRQIQDQYFSDPAIDAFNKTLFVFASYNAGPNAIARLRQQAEKEGLDPNKWFDNVELVVARDIGQVTVTYVGNVYKYYIAYKLATEESATPLDPATPPAKPK
jgi:membrane-bound lytic murein transglycosylase MltF